MSFLSTLLVLCLHISNADHSSVQCALLGKRLAWKAEYTYSQNVTSPAWITSTPQYPSPTQPPLAPAYTTSPLLLLDPFSRERQIVYSDADDGSVETATSFTDGAPVVVPIEPASSTPTKDFDPLITIPPTAFETFVALQLLSSEFKSVLALHSSAAPGCNPIPCEIIYNTVNIAYPNYRGQNTACLSTTGGSPLTGNYVQQLTSFDLLPSEPPFVVADFLYIGANDGCKKIGTSFINFKTTFYPGELSSLRDGTTYSYNFADLPCPPESVHPHQSRPYYPRIALPTFMTDLDRAWKTCKNGPSEGFDPIIALPRATGPSNVHVGGHFGVEPGHH